MIPPPAIGLLVLLAIFLALIAYWRLSKGSKADGFIENITGEHHKDETGSSKGKMRQIDQTKKDLSSQARSEQKQAEELVQDVKQIKEYLGGPEEESDGSGKEKGDKKTK